MDVVGILGVFSGATGRRVGDLLALVHYGCLRLAAIEVGRLRELRTLVELVVVRGVFVDRLGAFLILARDAQPHVFAVD